MEMRDPGRARRALVIAGFVALVLQVGIAPQIQILGGRFNFLLAFAGSCALLGEPAPAVVTGFIAGLCYDLTASVPVGLMTLLMTIGSFVLAGAAGGAATGLSGRSIQLVFIYALAICLVNGIALVIIGTESSILTALVGHGLTTAVLSTIAAVGFLAVQGRADTSPRGFSVRGRGGMRYKGRKGLR